MGARNPEKTREECEEYHKPVPDWLAKKRRKSTPPPPARPRQKLSIFQLSVDALRGGSVHASPHHIIEGSTTAREKL